MEIGRIDFLPEEMQSVESAEKHDGHLLFSRLIDNEGFVRGLKDTARLHRFESVKSSQATNN